MKMSILFPFIAPPLSSTTYTLSPIFNLVPNAKFDGAAIVRPAVAFLPDAVIPVDFPQHFEHAQYAVTLYVPILAIVFPAVTFDLVPAVLLLLDV